MTKLKKITNELLLLQKTIKKEKQRQDAWKEGCCIDNRDAELWRLDAWGFLICRHSTKGTYGWEIDHAHPKAKGGGDDDNNLQPLQWQLNRLKRDKTGKELKDLYSGVCQVRDFLINEGLMPVVVPEVLEIIKIITAKQ